MAEEREENLKSAVAQLQDKIQSLKSEKRELREKAADLDLALQKSKRDLKEKSDKVSNLLAEVESLEEGKMAQATIIGTLNGQMAQCSGLIFRGFRRNLKRG